MSTIVKGILQGRWQPQLVIIRNKTKVNITRPRLPHFDRAKVEMLCVPKLPVKKPPRYLPNSDYCVPVEEVIVLHPLENIIAKEALNWFNNSKIIAIFHSNSITSEESFNNQLLLKKNGFKYLCYGKKIINAAFKDTKFEPILPLFASHSAIAVSPQADIKTFLQISSKLEKLVCMAAIVENRLLSWREIQHFGKYKDIDEARGDLVCALQGASQRLVQNITHHPRNLVHLLNQCQEQKN